MYKTNELTVPWENRWGFRGRVHGVSPGYPWLKSCAKVSLVWVKARELFMLVASGPFAVGGERRGLYEAWSTGFGDRSPFWAVSCHFSRVL